MSTFENCQPETDASVEKCQPKPVKCGCGGEARVIKHEYFECSPTYGVTCYKCGSATNQGFDTEAEAIQAWNTAMNERTTKAKVNFKDENYFFGWCECGQYQSSQFPYCPACGARLEWK